MDLRLDRPPLVGAILTPRPTSSRPFVHSSDCDCFRVVADVNRSAVKKSSSQQGEPAIVFDDTEKTLQCETPLHDRFGLQKTFCREMLSLQPMPLREKSSPKRIVEIMVRWRRNHLYDPALGENADPRRKPFLQIPQLTFSNLPVDYCLVLIVQ